ncbi:MAG: class I SAM-dependent RNA methyltransferase [Bacteroidetes bacterium]|nr:class I SAM-dependent RNA methyltransferase [Bacteroidota bacterium]
MMAKTIFGLEETLAGELLRLGAKDVEIHNRAVSFVGDKGFMYKANLNARTALRILVPVETITVTNEKSLYEGIQSIDWEKYMDVTDTLAIDSVVNSDLFTHSQYVSQKAKDAIVDQFRAKHGERPSVDLDKPTIRINLHIFKDVCTVSLDSSGESLHKRGYRDKTNLAPINEVLAAGLVMLSGWDKRTNFIDPMCGSGTIVIEAALYANNIPAGYFREDFGFMRWHKFMPFDEELWDTIFDAAVNKITNHEQVIIGGELSPNVAKKAKENVKLAKVDDIVTIRNCDMKDFEVPPGRGVVIINPPYGERMVKDNIEELYKMMGDTFKQKFAGYNCWILSSNMDAFKHVGLRPTRKIALFNGQLECRFMKFEIYEGTKKIHKLEGRVDNKEQNQ